MGRAHSNAHRRLPNFFNLEYQTNLKTICDSTRKGQGLRQQWGYESVETDWHKLMERTTST